MPKSRPAAQAPKKKTRPSLKAVPLAWFKHLPTPCFILDKDARFLYANDAFIELTGYREDEIAGARFDTLLASAGLSQGLKELLDLYQGHAMTGAEQDMLRKTGTKLHVVLDIAPAFEGRAARITHAIGVVRSHEKI
jgi:PAS domain S-box-containing protein